MPETVCTPVPLYSTLLVDANEYVVKLDGKLFDPASCIVVPDALVNVPPLDERLAVNDSRFNVPDVIVKSLAIEMLPLKFALPDDLLIVKVPNVVASID